MSQQDIDVKGARGPHGEFGASGFVDVDQNARDVYQFMSRIEDQPSWYQGVKACEVLDVSGTTKRVKQVLQWNFLAIHGNFQMQLLQNEDPNSMNIKTEMVEGSMIKRFHSHVVVKPAGPNRCQLEMSMFMQPNIFVPFGIRHLVGGQVRRQLRGVLTSIKEKIESGACADATVMVSGVPDLQKGVSAI
eukprot:jgi/Chrzof1/4050/Cz13g18150.t1